MSLASLPEELLIIIIKQLDLKSVKNLYDAGDTHIRNILCTRGVVKKANFSLSTLGTAKSLKTDFFKAVASNIQELNLSGVYDLNKTVMLPAMRKLKSLTTLDVSYTNITILDLLDFYEVCPSIRNVEIDFQFHKPGPGNHFPKESLERCMKMFANFSNVHFIGSNKNLILSNLSYFILQKAKLNVLSYTIAKSRDMFTYHMDVQHEPINCNKFCVSSLGGELSIVFSKLGFEYEYAHISNSSLSCSPQISKFFTKNSKQKIYLDPEPYPYFDYGVVIVWNKETTVFDNVFYANLLSIIQQRPQHITADDAVESLPLKSDCFFLNDPTLKPVGNNETETKQTYKKRRIAPSCYELDCDYYDDLFKDKKYVKLGLCFRNPFIAPITFSSKSNFIHKLTFLSLMGTVRYSNDFFSILFRCCKNLITLNVEGPSISPCAVNLSRTISLSSSVRNLRIEEKKLDLNVLFSSLGQCKSLENIQIHDNSQVTNNLARPDTLFAQCDNLYYLSVQAEMSDTAKTKHLQMFNKSKLKYGKHHLFIEIFSKRFDCNYNHSPYMQVFTLNKISF